MTAVKNKHSLITRLKENSSKLKSYGVAKLSIFGSFVTEKHVAESDIDFLIEFMPEKKTMIIL